MMYLIFVTKKFISLLAVMNMNYKLFTDNDSFDQLCHHANADSITLPPTTLLKLPASPCCIIER